MNNIPLKDENINGKLKFRLCFESFGVKIGVRAFNGSFIKKLNKRVSEILPVEWKTIHEREAKHWFSVSERNDPEKEYEVSKETEVVGRSSSPDEIFSILDSRIRLTIAEFSDNFVFLHAGVVGWQDQAIIIPGKSFAGKTTLVAELIKKNCLYLSDEYAVIDKQGYVHPFPKKLSMRGIIDDFKQVDYGVEELGGIRAEKPLPVGLILITTYSKKVKKSKIRVNSRGEGIMASVANSISVRQNPKFVLEVLSIIADRAIILQSERGEAAEFAESLLTYLERIDKLRLDASLKSNVNWTN